MAVNANKITLTFIDNEEYEKAMLSYLKIKNKLEKFFEKVQVNEDNEKLRVNRLNILASIRETFIDFADFSLIEIRTKLPHNIPPFTIFP